MRRADRSIARCVGPEEPFRSLVPDPLDRVRPIALHNAAKRALTPKAIEQIDTDHVAPIRLSVADAAVTVLELLGERSSATFRELAIGAPTRLDVIVRFLAVLELFKQGIVDLEQLSSFSTLSVRRLAEGEIALDAAGLADWDEPVGEPTQRTNQ